jgi:hypothetical protein
MTSFGYIVRPSGVVHETIDGETVVIDMQQGNYYRLEGAASIAWERLTAGETPEHLCASLAARFAAEPRALEREVREFLDALYNFNLIEPHEASGAATAPIANDPGELFPGLTIQRFTDLQELFWVDPVHEVDDTGWPTARSVSGKN